MIKRYYPLSKVLYAIGLSIFMLPLATFCQREKLEITGNLSWLKNGDKLYLTLLDGALGNYLNRRVDSAISNKGNFTLKTVVTNGPRLFFIDIAGPKERFIHLVAGNEKIRISDGPYKNLPESGYFTQHVKIEGSPSSEEFSTVGLTLSHLATQYDNIFRSKINQIEKGEITYDKKFVEGLITARELYFWTLFYEIKELSNLKGFNEIIPQFVIDKYRLVGKDRNLKYIYDALSEEVKSSYYGKIVKQSLSTCIGETAPGFPVKLGDNKSGSLTDVVNSGKLTLLYFWSNEIPNGETVLELNSFYKKYHDKGFNIINVFAGTDSSAWKRMIEKEQMQGNHVADFKGMWNGIASQYGFTPEVRPFTILIDQSGKIVDWLVVGPILQFYLDKAF